MNHSLMLATLAGILALVAGAAPRPTIPAARNVPPLVFVSRNPPPASMAGVVPGLGPAGRTLETGGRLMVRHADGRVAPLLAPGRFHDVSDPSVSWDGKRIAFAATPAPDSAWRIYVVNADGTGLATLTRDPGLSRSPLGADADRFRGDDDFDPCWLPNGEICFASTRFPLLSEHGVRATNLWRVKADGDHVTRITSERGGGEEPSVDAETGRVVFARWWFNRHLASDTAPTGITLDRARAVKADSVDLWHAMSIMPDGDGGRLAGGNPRVRAETMAYQPIVLADGTLIGVRAERTSLLPDGGALVIDAYPRRFAPPRRLAGGGSRGSACAPVALPDRRILFSLDAGGTGDFGLYTVGLDGRNLERVLDLPGTLELDAAPLVRRTLPPVLQPSQSELPRLYPVRDERELRDSVVTFRFDCLNVFTNGGVDEPFPDAPPYTSDVRIRFYAALARPAAAGGDTVVLLRETPVTRSGAVHEHELPADTPLFEQLVDAQGRVLRSASGPAHVPGFNSGRYGHGTKCVGCHTGHSALPVAVSAHAGTWFNIAPSAEVQASSVAEGSAGARAAVDRRASGPSTQVAWIARTVKDEYLRLEWKTPIEVKTVVLYAISPQSATGTDLRVGDCEVGFYLNGREVRRSVLGRAVKPEGTRLECGGVRADRLELRPLRVTGRIERRAAAGLAEVETLARVVED